MVPVSGGAGFACDGRRPVVKLFKEAALEVDNRKLDEVSAASIISQLGMDSVAQMELVSWFEERLRVRIPDEELQKIRTISDLRDVLARLLPPGTQIAA
ncbi:MAG: acyl carrier protein [Deltaproteobacteria bacterium]|nr:MAG: acyl carrier protein [Deltaproteobacteria bacterium]